MSKQEIVKALNEIKEREINARYCEALDRAIEIIEEKEQK